MVPLFLGTKWLNMLYKEPKKLKGYFLDGFEILYKRASVYPVVGDVQIFSATEWVRMFS